MKLQNSEFSFRTYIANNDAFPFVVWKSLKNAFVRVDEISGETYNYESMLHQEIMFSD